MKVKDVLEKIEEIEDEIMVIGSEQLDEFDTNKAKEVKVLQNEKMELLNKEVI